MYIKFLRAKKFHAYSVRTGVTVCGVKFNEDHSNTRSVSTEIHESELCGNCKRVMKLDK